MKNRAKIKANQKTILKLKLIHIKIIVAISIITVLSIGLVLLFNIGVYEHIYAGKKTIKHFVSGQMGDWSDTKTWAETVNEIPNGNQIIEINHFINCANPLEISGKMHISKNGKLLAQRLLVKKSGELKIDGELIVDELIFEKGSWIHFSGDSKALVYKHLTNKKKSNNIVIDGEIEVLGNFINESKTEILGNGTIKVDGYFEGFGLEYSIAPIVKIDGDIRQLDKNPIDLLYFKAHMKDNKMVIHWSTAQETNNRVFTVEKSYDGEHFTEIRNVYGAGFSNRIINYSCVDNEVEKQKVFYRLKQSSFDGKETLINTIIANY